MAGIRHERVSLVSLWGYSGDTKESRERTEHRIACVWLRMSREESGMQGSPFNRVPMHRHFVLGDECCPVLQRRDMHHSVEEREGRIDVFARH